ncbi:hypothetical protein BJY00DRAFT_309367 [Aspergillus carlsbadensis]|nr:hypothetical protein BJY00DRAFT_309367 [Aspergillus carlsbadensis]
MAFRGFGKTSRPRRDGRAKTDDKSGKDGVPPPKTDVNACEERLQVLKQAFGPLENERAGQQQDSHQISDQKQLSALNSLSHPSDSSEVLSTGRNHARKRSCSLPAEFGSKTEEKHKTRTEAVTLLRARTLSRLSDSDKSPQDLIKGLSKLNLASASVEIQSDAMVRGEVSIMDFVTQKKPKKKSKAKKKKKGAAAGSDVATCSESEALKKDAAALPSTQPSTANESVEAPKTPEATQTQAKDLIVFTPSPSQPNPRSSPNPMKEKLPSAKEGQIKQGSVTSESPDLRASTPKSTGTSSSLATSWTTNPYASFSPQTTAVSAPSTGHRNKQRSAIASRSVATTNSSSTLQAPVINTHAHPSPSSSSTIAKDIQTSRGQRITTQRPEGFFWQLDSHGFPCAKSDCDSRCNLWDGATVICPRCGPFSETRYCSREHLLKDIKVHWASCGQNVFQHPCRESTIPKDVRDRPPLIPCLHPYDTPERHRQAVYLNMHSSAGDYFIFSDFVDMVEAGFPEDHLNLRCSNRILCAVKITDPQAKDRFRRVLAACLFVTLESHALTDYLFRLIRDNLRMATLPPTTSLPTLETSLKYQLHHETGVTIQPGITGERHACETDWTGTNRRNCPDPVCRAEYRRLLGSLGGHGHGHEALVEHLEASYWLLRAARTTHPDVEDAGERMKGVGFENVAEEDQRVFCRGDGWDGAGAGEMEVEGINA